MGAGGTTQAFGTAPADQRISEVLSWTAVDVEAQPRPFFWGQAQFFDSLHREGLGDTTRLDHEVLSAERGALRRKASDEDAMPWAAPTDGVLFQEKPPVPTQEPIDDPDMGGPIPEDGMYVDGHWYSRQELLEAGWEDRVMIFYVAWIPPSPPSSYCRCPVEVLIRGGAESGGFELDQREADKLWPGCRGTDMEVVVKVKWVPCPEFRPCVLEWREEWSTRNGSLSPGQDDDKCERGRNDDRFNNSDVFIPWWYHMDDSYPRLYSSDQRKSLRAYQEREAANHKEGHTIVMRDTPCFHPDDVITGGRDLEREIHGRVVVKSGGCEPPCDPESVEARWAQCVKFYPHTEKLASLVFETDSYQGKRWVRPSRANKGNEFTEWSKQNEWRRMWKSEK